MSRVGKAIVKLPAKVEVKQSGDNIQVKGPLGELQTPLFEGITFETGDGTIQFVRSNEEKKTIAKHGLVRSLFNNSVKGVSEGWTRNLEIFGVGFRAAVKGNDLVMNLGYSHEVVFPTPQGIKIEVVEQLKIKISGIDKQLVGQVAADIRSKRPPEPYKGKGIKYSDEVIKRKAGKTGKK
ncbi:MAG: 50S ribosomal protein L6 [Leptospira sp.]|nr:50S ribosomal protein L6 [Leptospira sp.]